MPNLEPKSLLNHNGNFDIIGPAFSKGPWSAFFESPNPNHYALDKQLDKIKMVQGIGKFDNVD